MSRAEQLGWACGVVGLAVAAFGWIVAPARFHLAWIAMLSTWLGWPLGSIALLLIHRLTGGAWGDALGPPLRLGAANLWLLLPALLPLLLGLGVYPWARHPPPHSHLYFNLPFFVVRVVLYAALWLALGAATRRWSGTALAAAGLPLLALSFTFAAIDLTLSLHPQFSSSVYGLLQGTAAVLFALSIATVPAAAAAPIPIRADIGKLLLALTVLWAYLDFMQFLIVWESNLPNEAAYYRPRLTGGWGGVFTAEGLLHFLLPLGLLVLPQVQRSRIGLMAVAALLACMEVLRGWWLVLPESGAVDWIDIGCVLGFGGISAGCVWRAGRRASVQHV